MQHSKRLHAFFGVGGRRGLFSARSSSVTVNGHCRQGNNSCLNQWWFMNDSLGSGANLLPGTLIVWLKMRADHETPRLLADKLFIGANNLWIFFSFLLTSGSSVCDGDTQWRCFLLPIECFFHRDVWWVAQFLKNVLKRTQIKQTNKKKRKTFTTYMNYILH